MECPACGEIPKNSNRIECENGHIQCVKCTIKRIRTQYQMTQSLHLYRDGNDGQKCFTCRCLLHDEDMPKNFQRLLLLSLVIEMGNIMGYSHSKKHAMIKKAFRVCDVGPSLC